MCLTLARVREQISRRRKLLWRCIAVLLVLWLSYLGLAAWGVPKAVRSVTLAQVPEVLGREARVGEVSFNPFTLRLRVHDFAILDPSGTNADFSVSQLEVNASISSLFRLAPVIDALSVTAPRLTLVREPGDRFNISDILDRLAARPASEGGPPPRFSLNNLTLEEGEITVEDQVTGRRHTVRDLRLGIPFLSTLAYATRIDVEPRLSALVNGSPFNLEGSARPFDTPRTSSLHVKLEDFGLDALADAIPGAVPLKFRRARLDTDAQLIFDEGTGGPPKVRLEGNATLREVDVRAPGDAHLLGFDRLAVERFALEPLARRFETERVALYGPRLHASRAADGRINLSEVAAQFQKPAAGPSPADPAPSTDDKDWHVAVGALVVEGGALEWRDEGAKFDYRVSDLNVELRDVKLPASADQVSPVSLSARLGEQGKLQVGGPLRLQPLAADLDVDLEDLALPPLAPAWAPYLALRVEDGTLGLGAKLSVAQGESLSVRWREGRLALRRLRAATNADKASSLKLEQLELSGVAGDLAERTAKIQRVAVNGVTLAANRSRSSDIGWASVLPAKAPSRGGAPASAPASPEAPWQFAVEALSLQKAGLQFTDEAVRPRVRLRLDDLRLDARNLSSNLGAPIEFTLSSSIQGRGSAALQGTVVPQPLAVKAQVRARRVNLTALAPYLSDRLNAAVNSIVVGANGRLEYAAAAQGRPQRAAWVGSAEVSDLEMTDKLNSADFLKWRRLAFRRINVSSTGDTLEADLGDITLEDFFARVILNEQGRLNLTQIMVEPGQEAGSITDDTPAAQSKPAEPPGEQADDGAAAPASKFPEKIRVGEVRLARGNINFTDNFVKPNYRANLTDIEGSISAVSSTDTQPADVQVAAKLDGNATVDITGKLHPFGPRLYTDIRASAKGVDLPDLTPYAAKYAGYAIERGKLSMDVHYQIEDGKLQASNKIFLDQLTFGERVESPDALNLPVLLAVSLLKNSRGEIDIELPVSGSLDDPQFSIGGIIFRALINLIGRAVTAPFSLLAAAFGGSGEELSHIEFAPGSAVLDEEARKRIDVLVKALNDRPGLKLDVSGRADPKVDAEGLRKAGVEELIRAQQRAALRRGGEAPPDKDLPPLDAQQRATYLERAYKAAKIDKPRNALGFAKSLPGPEMESLLEASITVGPEQLRELAARRAQAVMSVLREAKLGERAFLIAPRVESKGEATGKPVGVEFSLK